MKIGWKIVLIGLFCFVNSLSSANVSARSLLVSDADNKYDPVSGKTIKVKKYNTVYKKNRYWFNSYDNLKIFKKSPKKYIMGVVEKRKGGNLENKKSSPAPKQQNAEEKKTFWGW
jgi:YHS domain-containing protein